MSSFPYELRRPRVIKITPISKLLPHDRHWTCYVPEKSPVRSLALSPHQETAIWCLWLLAVVLGCEPRTSGSSPSSSLPPATAQACTGSRKPSDDRRTAENRLGKAITIKQKSAQAGGSETGSDVNVWETIKPQLLAFWIKKRPGVICLRPHR